MYSFYGMSHRMFQLIPTIAFETRNEKLCMIFHDYSRCCARRFWKWYLKDSLISCIWWNVSYCFFRAAFSCYYSCIPTYCFHQVIRLLSTLTHRLCTTLVHRFFFWVSSYSADTPLLTQSLFIAFVYASIYHLQTRMCNCLRDVLLSTLLFFKRGG